MGKPERERAPSPVNPGDSVTGQEVCHEGPPTRSPWGGYHLSDQAAPRGGRTSSTRKVKPQTPNLFLSQPETRGICPLEGQRKLSFIKTKVVVFHGRILRTNKKTVVKSKRYPPCPRQKKIPTIKIPTRSVPPPCPGSVATRRTTIYKIWYYVALKRAVIVTCGAIWQMPQLAHPLRALCC